MGFRRGGAGKRRDAIEGDVIKELRSRGVLVWQINGRALPDVLCLYAGEWKPLGIKSGEKSRLTQSERAEPPLWPLVHSVQEALRMFGW